MNTNEIFPQESNDYTFLDFDTPKRCHHGQFLSVSSGRISISAEISTEIKDKGLTRARLRIDNITNDVHVVFNRERGVELTTPTHGFQLRIGSREFAKAVARLMEFKLSNMSVKVELSEDLSNSADYATYKLLGSHE